MTQVATRQTCIREVLGSNLYNCICNCDLEVSVEYLIDGHLILLNYI
jgi:hypothetical protein